MTGFRGPFAILGKVRSLVIAMRRRSVVTAHDIRVLLPNRCRHEMCPLKCHPSAVFCPRALSMRYLCRSRTWTILKARRQSPKVSLLLQCQKNCYAGGGNGCDDLCLYSRGDEAFCFDDNPETVDVNSLINIDALTETQAFPGSPRRSNTIRRSHRQQNMRIKTARGKRRSFIRHWSSTSFYDLMEALRSPHLSLFC